MSLIGINPLLEEPNDPLLAQAVRGSTVALARATRPDFIHNRNSPVEWTPDDWQGLEAGRRELFDMAAVRAQFDREQFLVDGYAILAGVMHPQAARRWREALQRGQALNDALLCGDWSAIDWRGLGRTPPEQELTAEEIEAALGRCQKAPQKSDIAGVQWLRWHSVFAEYFPAGHVPFCMDLLTHPQMLELQRLCLGRQELHLDHNQMLNRPGGYAGGSWHSHMIFDDCDQAGVATIAEYDDQPNFNLTLCYPDGFTAGDDGGLKVIRGSHLFRDPQGCRAATDEEMEAGWMRGRRHPVTGVPLAIEQLELPPGSIVSCLSHAAHCVAPKAVGRPTRWCTLACYRVAAADGSLPAPHSVPPVWAMKAQRGELPPVLTGLLRSSFDRDLTSGTNH